MATSSFNIGDLNGGISALNDKIENPVYTLSITSSAPSTWSGFIALMNKGVGTYYISTSSATRTTLNSAGIIPTTDAGTFVVIYTASNLLTMEYTPYTGSNRYTASYDQSGFKGWEMLALNSNLSNLGNLHCSHYWNSSTIALDIGFAPTVGKQAVGMLVNGNQQVLSILDLSNTPAIYVVNGTKTFTITLSGNVFTITANGTLWGPSMILWTNV